MAATARLSCLALALSLLASAAQADVLVATNGEQFIGKVIEEATETVVFESEIGGKLTIPRTRIREIQRTLPLPKPTIPDHSLLITNGPPVLGSANERGSTNLFWLPPSIGHDKEDWLQLKSGEWLRGQLKYIQQKRVEFDSDELDEQTLKLKDVRQIYPAEPMFAKFNDRDAAFGKIVLSNDLVSVTGPEQVELPRDQLIGITPSGAKGMRDWSGSLSIGLGLQSGNRQLATATASGELARRTPNTSFLLDYLGNYSRVNSVENANNQRVNGTYDIRLDRHWFIRAAQLEYYHDPIANVALRGTASVGAGYYIFDRDDLDWLVAAGPAYQYTQFETVEPGRSDTATTPAGVLQSKFDMDITRRLDLHLSYRGILASQQAGQYMHHAVATLSFEIKRHLNLDVSYIWDYLQSPQTESDGSPPQKSDYYLTVGLGVRF